MGLRFTIAPHPAFTGHASKAKGADELHGVQQAFQPWVFLGHGVSCSPSRVSGKLTRLNLRVRLGLRVKQGESFAFFANCSEHQKNLLLM